MPLLVFRQFLKLCDDVLFYMKLCDHREWLQLVTVLLPVLYAIAFSFYLRSEQKQNNFTAFGRQKILRTRFLLPTFVHNPGHIHQCRDSGGVSEIKTHFDSVFWKSHISATEVTSRVHGFTEIFRWMVFRSEIFRKYIPLEIPDWVNFKSQKFKFNHLFIISWPFLTYNIPSVMFGTLI